MITGFSRLYQEVPDVGFHTRLATHQIEEPTADELVRVILELIPYVDPNRLEQKKGPPWAGDAANALDNFVRQMDHSPVLPWADIQCRKAAEGLSAWSYGHGPAPTLKVLVAALERVATAASEQLRNAEQMS